MYRTFMGWETVWVVLDIYMLQSGGVSSQEEIDLQGNTLWTWGTLSNRTDSIVTQFQPSICVLRIVGCVGSAVVVRWIWWQNGWWWAPLPLPPPHQQANRLQNLDQWLKLVYNWMCVVKMCIEGSYDSGRLALVWKTPLNYSIYMVQTRWDFQTNSTPPLP